MARRATCVRVLGPVVAAFGQLDDAAAADVGIAIGLRDLLAVPRDVVEHQPFAQRQSHSVMSSAPRRRTIASSSTAPATDEIGAARLEPGHAQPFLEAELDELLPDAAQLLGRDAPVAQQRAGRAPLRPPSRCAPRLRIVPDVPITRSKPARAISSRYSPASRVDVLDQLALVARHQRIALDEALGQTDHAELEAAARFDVRADAARDFDAAAADVDDHGRFAGAADAVDRGQMDEPGFLRARDDARADSGLFGDRVEELAAVFGFADRAGRRRRGSRRRGAIRPAGGISTAPGARRASTSGVSARPSSPPAPRRTISFSRSMISKDRSGRTRTTIMCSELVPMSMAAMRIMWIPEHLPNAARL